jgi:hypothetical protein
MPCTVCKHNQVKDIDRALLCGVSLTSLSQTYGFTTTALQLHKKQLLQKMAQAEKRFHDGLRQGVFCKLYSVMEMVLGIVRGARAGEDFKLFLQASREFTRIVSLMVKMDVNLEPELIYCLMATPQWDFQDSQLPEAVQALNKTKQSLKVNLYAPCSEPEPEPEPASVQTPTVEMCTLQLDTLTAAASPKRQRDMSAESARNIAPEKIINKEYQYDSLNKNSIEERHENLWQHVAPKRQKSGK